MSISNNQLVISCVLHFNIFTKKCTYVIIEIDKIPDRIGLPVYTVQRITVGHISTVKVQ